MSFDRAANLRRLADEHFDVLVIGGGIVGTGVALDAVTRGLRTALVERHDFASGTSSKSSKLIHGGLRYLQNGEYRLVYEALHERQRLRHNAPHLVRQLPFMIPILTRDGLMNPKIARAFGSALWTYDLTGGWRIGKLHQRLTADEAHARLPTLERDRLAAAYLYFDAEADDARLCLTVARTAAHHGASVANRTEVVGLVRGAGGLVAGVEVEADGQRFSISSTVVINATGVWSDRVRALDEGADPRAIRPAKGIHLTVPWSTIRNDGAVVIPVPKDKRSLFVVPYGELTYIGTTDTDYDGPLDDPQCTRADIDYVLDAVNAALPGAVTTRDVLGTWAGLRPLVQSATSDRTADLSRRHVVARSASGMISVNGGKLTTYREMAADAVDEACRMLDLGVRSHTARTRLLGAEGFEEPAGEGLHVHLAHRYGTEAATVLRIVAERAELAEPLVPGLPYVKAEAVHAVRTEMATTLDDVLARRTRARILARDDSAAAAGIVAALIGGELGWDAGRAEREAADYRASVARERNAPGLPETALAAQLGA